MNKQVEWDGIEYIDYEHNVSWYVGLFAVIACLCGLAAILQWWSFLILLVLVLIIVLMRSFRKASTIHYVLDNEGLREGNQMHKYSDFKAFGILQEGQHYSVVLIPKKRFGLSVKVYFSKNNGETIVDMLGARLPMEDVKLDFMDRLINLLRI